MVLVIKIILLEKIKILLLDNIKNNKRSKNNLFEMRKFPWNIARESLNKRFSGCVECQETQRGLYPLDKQVVSIDKLRNRVYFN